MLTPVREAARRAGWLNGWAARSCAGLRSHGLVFQASAFQRILQQGETLAQDPQRSPLLTLSPARRGKVLEAVVKDCIHQMSPCSILEEPTVDNPACRRSSSNAEWDWTMDGRKVEVKSASLLWMQGRGFWRALFQGVKLAREDIRKEAPFDDLLLALLSPAYIDIIKHDLRTHVCSAGVVTSAVGHNIDVMSSRGEACWKAARKQILEKLRRGGCSLLLRLEIDEPNVTAILQRHMPEHIRSEDSYQGLPLSLTSPPRRGFLIQQVALQLDRMMHPQSAFCLPEGEVTVSGTQRSWWNASVDWIRDGTRVEVKSSQLQFIGTGQWKCSFQNIKFPSSFDDDQVFDELWLAIYSPIGIHFIKHASGVGVSRRGVVTASRGYAIQLYAPKGELDCTVALRTIVANVTHRGCVLLATIHWDRHWDLGHASGQDGDCSADGVHSVAASQSSCIRHHRKSIHAGATCRSAWLIFRQLSLHRDPNSQM